MFFQVRMKRWFGRLITTDWQGISKWRRLWRCYKSTFIGQRSYMMLEGISDHALLVLSPNQPLRSNDCTRIHLPYIGLGSHHNRLHAISSFNQACDTFTPTPFIIPSNNHTHTHTHTSLVYPSSKMCSEGLLFFPLIGIGWLVNPFILSKIFICKWIFDLILLISKFFSIWDPSLY